MLCDISRAPNTEDHEEFKDKLLARTALGMD